MRKNLKYILGLILVIFVGSCKKDLDINDNPNKATSTTPELVLPQSIVGTAGLIRQYNTYGAQTVGYFANGGGVSGWGAIISYNYSTTDFQGLWNNTYDVLADVQYVLDNTDGKDDYKVYNAVAKILKAYSFQLLVDTYNDVPYTEAFKGNEILQPKYDKATDVYKSITDLLDEAVTALKGTAVPKSFPTADPLFAGNTTSWIKLANTIKLKLILKGQGKVTFSNTTIDDTGFLTTDAIVNPGYAKIDGKQNPMWNAWAYDASGTAVGAASNYAPTPFILTFYNGNKILDEARADVVYHNGIATPVNQLGYQQDDAGRGQTPSSWFAGTNANTYDKIGILKGPDAGQPIFLASESYFLQAEGILKNIISGGSAQANFESGVASSFNYLYLNNAGTVAVDMDPNADAAEYKVNNEGNPLVDFSAATTTEQQIQAIITQKYIAFNMLFGHEAWNEYRRTGYPAITGTDKSSTFVSLVTEATAPDKLPTRILYPDSEFRYNEKNIPDVNKYSSKIFWAK